MCCWGFFVLKQHWIRLWNPPLSFIVSDNLLFMTVFQLPLKWCHFTKCYLSLQKWWISLQLLAEPWPSCLHKDLCLWYKRGTTGCPWESEWRWDARALGWNGNQRWGQLPGNCLRVQVQILTDFLLKLLTVAQGIKIIGVQTGQSWAQKM